MKRIFALLIVLCLLLVGCGCKHEWEEATCQDPKTCRLCGETEGEPLGHDYTSATCTQPETCRHCGKEREPALCHAPGAPANYQQGQHCERCGEPLCDVLEPGFVTHGLECTVEVGVPTEYVTTAKWNDTQAVGEIEVLDYHTLSPQTDEAEIASLEELYGFPLEQWEGYEWRVMYSEFRLPLAAVRANQLSIDYCFEDYYTPELNDDNATTDELGLSNTVISWYGEHMPAQYAPWIVRKGYDYDRQIYYFLVDYIIHVPIGYDGLVFGFKDSRLEWSEGAHIYDVADENTRFFRLK